MFARVLKNERMAFPIDWQYNSIDRVLSNFERPADPRNKGNEIINGTRTHTRKVPMETRIQYIVL